MATANLPLPPGWEEKWDHITKKSFYVNHYTKTTTWIDPRVALKNLTYSAPSKQQETSFSGVVGSHVDSTTKIPTEAFKSGSPKIIGSQIDTPKKLPPISVLPSSGRQASPNKQSTSYALEDLSEFERYLKPEPFKLNESLLNKLKAEYADAKEADIKASLESGRNDELIARRFLEDKGYKTREYIEMKVRGMAVLLAPNYPKCPDGVLKSVITSCDLVKERVVDKLKSMGYLTVDEELQQRKDSAENPAKPEGNSPSSDVNINSQQKVKQSGAIQSSEILADVSIKVSNQQASYEAKHRSAKTDDKTKIKSTQTKHEHARYYGRLSLAKGPNRKLVKGPQKSLAKGPMGAVIGSQAAKMFNQSIKGAVQI